MLDEQLFLLSTEVGSDENEATSVAGLDEPDALDAVSLLLGSTFSAVVSHILTSMSRWSGGGRAGEAKDGCLLIGENGARPAAPIPPRPPDSGPVGVVGVARPPAEPAAHSWPPGPGRCVGQEAGDCGQVDLSPPRGGGGGIGLARTGVATATAAAAAAVAAAAAGRGDVARGQTAASGPEVAPRPQPA